MKYHNQIIEYKETHLGWKKKKFYVTEDLHKCSILMVTMIQ